MKQTIVNCPQCGKAVAWNTANPHRPFCSERCKMHDLGQWVTESYRIREGETEEEQSMTGKRPDDFS